ncbi:MAG: OmpA family protein [Sulfuricurvum sp.]|uniref:OmpA family protein n=1 Tax=Sulfuricurvum sp. TaxID=2025608 RepID=UPI002632231F|nr:OmpA family protein [Sulfuricurvum sp.]MDD2829841.1 OmpA family protein [Sulfuricurvum sp.]MDD4949105.1 OmpA family protein [Sulfuricurvum sp.]
MKRTSISLLMAGFLFIGCAESGLTKAQTGALIGGLAGAVAGKSTSNHSNKRAVIGGAVGALAGYGIGAYMDKQQADLNQELKGSGVQVDRQGNNINLNMPGGITFDTAQANIKPNFTSVLDDIANIMSKYPETKIEVQGHTDNVGSDTNNLTLSQLRAQSVATYLTSHGVDSSRIKSVGYGESMPKASNDTPAGRESNRRVEIKIVPNPA